MKAPHPDDPSPATTETVTHLVRDLRTQLGMDAVLIFAIAPGGAMRIATAISGNNETVRHRMKYMVRELRALADTMEAHSNDTTKIEENMYDDLSDAYPPRAKA